MGRALSKMVRGDGMGSVLESDSPSNRTQFSRARFDKKCSGFGSKSEYGTLKSNFSRAYNRGEVPCRINHGGVNHHIQWEEDPNDMSYDPLLEGAAEKTVPLVNQLVPHLRNALRSKDDDVFVAALAATCQLSNVVGEYLDPAVDSLLIQIGKHVQSREHGPLVTETLQTLEANGGPKTLVKIKKKVPTYCSINI